MVACSRQQQGSDSQTATGCLELAEAALAKDSIQQGETLLRKTIQFAEASEDWHTCYIAYQRLAEALSQGNPEEALRLMKKALTVYEQHPDDERNYVMLLDYAGTFAAQVAYINVGAFDEALDFIHRAYDIAKKNQMNDMMCQTLTSLANIAWAQEDYRQALDYAHQAEPMATDELRSGTLQVLARSYLSLNMLDSAENVYRKIRSDDNVHLAYIVQSNLAKIALRRMGATQVEDSVAEAFDKVEDIYYKALEQKDEYYQKTLRQEIENQQLEYRSRIYARTLLVIIIASLIVISAMGLVIRYRMQAQRQAQRQLQQEAEHQKTLLHQANEVVAFLQQFILELEIILDRMMQGIDNGVACDENAFRLDILCQQVALRSLRRGKVEIRNAACKLAVHLLGEGAVLVMGAQACFHMAYCRLMIVGSQGTSKSCRGIAMHQHDIRLFRLQQPVLESPASKAFRARSDKYHRAAFAYRVLRVVQSLLGLV